MRQSYYKYGRNAYIVKMDVKKFFYTIDRSILKKIIRKKIKCKRTLNLLDKIIDNSPGEIGLPLGNLTSQLFANIYLNEIDQYCKRILKLKYYIRYADDIIVIVENKEHAQYILNNVNKYIKTTLNIELHENKSKIFPIYQGINSIGFKNYITHKLLRNDCKKKIKRKIKSFKYLYENKRITKEKIEQIVNSWHGHSKKANQYNFIIKLLKLNHYLSYDKTKIYWNFQYTSIFDSCWFFNKVVSNSASQT
jgi:RNA-directed DNA polymerase